MIINKVFSHPTVDFAAEELKKYLRMMSPEGGDIKISYDPKAKARGLDKVAEERFVIFANEFATMEPYIRPYANLSQNIATVKQLLFCDGSREMALVVE